MYINQAESELLGHGCPIIPLGDLRIHGHISLAMILRCEACITTARSCLVARPDQVHLELTLKGNFGESLLDKLLRRGWIRRKALSAFTSRHKWRVMQVGWCRRLDRGASDEGETACGSSKTCFFDSWQRFAFPGLQFVWWGIVSWKLTSCPLSLIENQAVIFCDI